jgi:quinolinate synthase
LLLADYIGSTSQLIDYTAKDDSMSYIVATEYGVIHQMKLKNQDKDFIPAPPEYSSCGCNDCSFMKMINLKKLYFSLKYEYPTINLPADIIERARLPIERMIAIK